jgi:hypothetical protein
MDALCGVLRIVRITSAGHLDGEFSPPRCVIG